MATRFLICQLCSRLVPSRLNVTYGIVTTGKYKKRVCMTCAIDLQDEMERE